MDPLRPRMSQAPDLGVARVRRLAVLTLGAAAVADSCLRVSCATLQSGFRFGGGCWQLDPGSCWFLGRLPSHVADTSLRDRCLLCAALLAYGGRRRRQQTARCTILSNSTLLSNSS